MWVEPSTPAFTVCRKAIVDTSAPRLSWTCELYPDTITLQLVIWWAILPSILAIALIQKHTTVAIYLIINSDSQKQSLHTLR
jgi:hypothetical protein